MTTTLEARLAPSNVNVHYIKDKRRLMEISPSSMSESVNDPNRKRQEHDRHIHPPNAQSQPNTSSGNDNNMIINSNHIISSTASAKMAASTATTNSSTRTANHNNNNNHTHNNNSNDHTDFITTEPEQLRQRDDQQHQQAKLKNGDICHFGIFNGFEVEKATVWHRDKVDDYRMRSKNRGICLIINNIDFEMESLPTRKGSDMDAYRFKVIFKQLGFSVECKRNLTSEKMRATFRQVAARCESKHDALVVILLSHGTESGIFGTDFLEVDTNDILTYFDNKRCKKMMDKPKMFIIQACRGRLADYGVRDTQSFFTQPDTQQTQPSQIPSLNSESPKISRWSELDKNGNPTRTDMILCFSCPTGYVSTRNEEEGSWLGASLAFHLQREAHRKHLIEIFNMVSRDVRRCKSVDGHKQVLEITSIGFDRNLYFNPGLVE